MQFFLGFLCIEFLHILFLFNMFQKQGFVSFFHFILGCIPIIWLPLNILFWVIRQVYIFYNQFVSYLKIELHRLVDFQPSKKNITNKIDTNNNRSIINNENIKRTTKVVKNKNSLSR